MRLFVSGSAPLLAETHREWRARTGHAILERYGMTETNMNTSNPYDGDRVAGTVGFPLPGVSARVVDPESGKGLGADEIDASARKLLAAGYALDIYDPAIDADKLVGANLGYAYSHLPTIEGLLVDRATAETRPYVRVIAANATVKDLVLPPETDIRDLGSLP